MFWGALKSSRALSSLHWLLWIITFGQESPHFHLSLGLTDGAGPGTRIYGVTLSHVLPWELGSHKPEVIPWMYILGATLGVGRVFLLLSHRAPSQRGTSASGPSKVTLLPDPHSTWLPFPLHQKSGCLGQCVPDWRLQVGHRIAA